VTSVEFNEDKDTNNEANWDWKNMIDTEKLEELKETATHAVDSFKHDVETKLEEILTSAVKNTEEQTEFTDLKAQMEHVAADLVEQAQGKAQELMESFAHEAVSKETIKEDGNTVADVMEELLAEHVDGEVSIGVSEVVEEPVKAEEQEELVGEHLEGEASTPVSEVVEEPVKAEELVEEHIEGAVEVVEEPVKTEEQEELVGEHLEGEASTPVSEVVEEPVKTEEQEDLVGKHLEDKASTTSNKVVEEPVKNEEQEELVGKHMEGEASTPVSEVVEEPVKTEVTDFFSKIKTEAAKAIVDFVEEVKSEVVENFEEFKHQHDSQEVNKEPKVNDEAKNNSTEVAESPACEYRIEKIGQAVECHPQEPAVVEEYQELVHKGASLEEYVIVKTESPSVVEEDTEPKQMTVGDYIVEKVEEISHQMADNVSQFRDELESKIEESIRDEDVAKLPAVEKSGVNETNTSVPVLNLPSEKKQEGSFFSICSIL